MGAIASQLNLSARIVFSERRRDIAGLYLAERDKKSKWQNTLPVHRGVLACNHVSTGTPA